MRIFAGMVLGVLLSGCSAGPAIDTAAIPKVSHRLDGVSIFAIADAGWTRAMVQKWTKQMPQRLAECGIRLGVVKITMTEQSDPHKLAEEIKPSGPLIIFADNTGTDVYGRTSGGVTVNRNGRRYAIIARRSSSGSRFKPEQTTTHELGHLLGLEHAPAVDAGGKSNIDLMQPRGCLYCSFTPMQCEKMRYGLGRKIP
ncbi:MAG: hypothetical protein GY762_20190 [Proteobacteria bacterium]|nr:hypothetical protein [Pseudomonadota bacterium]